MDKIVKEQKPTQLGNDIYRKSFGSQKVDTSNSPPLTADTVTWIASQTKLTTSVATMQIVERGLIGLDDDICQVLPRLKDLKVLTGFEGDEDQVAESEAHSQVDHDDEGSSGPYNAKPPPKPKGRPILQDLQGPITLR